MEKYNVDRQLMDLLKKHGAVVTDGQALDIVSRGLGLSKLQSLPMTTELKNDLALYSMYRSMEGCDGEK